MKWFICTIFMLVAGSLWACERVHMSASKSWIDVSQFSQGVFDHAMRVETNYQRCLARLPALSVDERLVVAALAHSQWQLSVRKLSHQSTLAGRKTPGERIFALGFKRFAAENLGWTPLYAFPADPFRVLNASRCQFETQRGEKIGLHSYQSFAANAINALMNSPGHRANILSVHPVVVGHAAVYDTGAPNCGNMLFTQKFAQ